MESVQQAGGMESPRIMSPRITSPRITSPRITSPRITSPRLTSSRADGEMEQAASIGFKEDEFAEVIAKEFVLQGKRRRAPKLARSPGMHHCVHIYAIPTTLMATHRKEFRAEDMVLGLFAEREKYCGREGSDTFKFKVAVVDAFIAILNADMGPNGLDSDLGPREQADGEHANSKDDSSIDIDKSTESKAWKGSGMTPLVTTGKTLVGVEPEQSGQIGEDAPSRSTESKGLSWSRFEEIVVLDPQEALNHYSLTEKRDSGEVRSILALDSAFLCIYLVVYLVQKKMSLSPRPNSSRHSHGEPYGIISDRSPSFHNRVLDDIAKLQNQIPFYLINQVLHIRHRYSRISVPPEHDRNDIWRGWINHHRESLPGYRPTDLDYLSRSVDDSPHLLAALCHVTQRHEPSPSTMNPDSRSLSRGLKKIVKYLSKRWHEELLARAEPLRTTSLTSASRMRKSGIYFRGQANGTWELVPKFEPGLLYLSATLYIPSLSVVMNTEMLWRNMLVFLNENNTSKSRDDGAHFIYFLMFMDELIDTERDVEILREGENPVIQKNLLGDNKKVAELFNTIISHQVTGKDSYEESEEWRNLIGEIHHFVNQRNRVVFLDFLRENFGKPWLIISVFVALLIFVLSFLQSLYAVVAYYRPPS